MRDITEIVTIEGYKNFLIQSTLDELKVLEHIRNGIARYDVCNDQLICICYNQKGNEIFKEIRQKRDTILKAVAKNILRVMGENIDGEISLKKAGDIVELFISIDIDSILSELNQM